MSVTGNWNLIVKTPFGEQRMKTSLSEEGGALTGTMDDSQNPAGPILDGALKDGLLTWKFPVRKPFSAKIAFSVTLEGDKLVGTCKAGVFPAASVSGSRV